MRFFLLLLAVKASAATIIKDEPLRLQAISAVFPGMIVTPTDTRIDTAMPFSAHGITFNFPDALKDERVYEIDGPPQNSDESCAAEDDLDPRLRSRVREIRFELFEISQRDDVAVMQYEFRKANPAMDCPSLARVALLSRNKDGFLKRDDRILDTVHHWDLERIRFAYLTGGPSEELIIENEAGGAGTLLTELLIFDVTHQRLKQILLVDSFVSAALEKEDLSKQTLDIPATQQQGGKRFCFAVTTYIDQDKAFAPPRVTHPCYPPD